MVVSLAAASAAALVGGLSFLSKLSRLVQVPMIAEFCGRAILRASVAALRKDLSADRFSRVRRGEGRINKSHDTVRDLARRGDVFDGVGDSIMHRFSMLMDGQPKPNGPQRARTRGLRPE